MGNSKKRKKKKKVGYNSLGMIAIALVVLVLLGGLMLESNDLKERLTGYDAKAATLQQQIEDEQTRTEEIDKLKKDLPNDSKLDIALDNTVFIKKSVVEVAETLAISVVLVIIIIFLFFRISLQVLSRHLSLLQIYREG